MVSKDTSKGKVEITRSFLKHELGNELRAVSSDDFGVVRVIRLTRAGSDDTDERIVARAVALLDEQAGLRGDETGGDAVVAADDDGVEVVDHRRERVGLCGHDLNVVQIFGDVLDLGRELSSGIVFDQAGGLEQLERAAAVGGIVGDADAQGLGGKGGSGKRSPR